MTSLAIPQIDVRPRRLLTANGRNWVEPTWQPMFSSGGLNAAALPQELLLFGYGIGDVVPGAGQFAGVAATEFHTNMDKGGTLSKPKLFTALGLRIYLAQLATSAANTPALSDPTFDAAAGSNSDLFDDSMLALGTGTVRFRVGEKDYIDNPMWMAPGKTGFGGIAALANDNGTAATLTALDTTLVHTEGPYFSLEPYPVLIEDSQSFLVQLRWPWTTPPTIVDSRLIVAVLDGALSREVM